MERERESIHVRSIVGQLLVICVLDVLLLKHLLTCVFGLQED